jgi:hypothetical protein
MYSRLNTALLVGILVVLCYHTFHAPKSVGRFVPIEKVMLVDTTTGQVCMPPTLTEKRSEASNEAFPPCKP